MTRHIRTAALFLLGLAQLAIAPARSASTDALEQRIDALVARMTLDEKIGQMSQSTSMGHPISEAVKAEIRAGRWGSFLNAGSAGDRAEAQRIALKESRLGIPLIFGRDVIHGYQTVFPIPLGQAASWDPDLVEQAAHIAARETAADGIHWTFAPMVDIARDPRWGRIAEGMGEDPYLGSAMAAAMVRGFQGKVLDGPESIAACVKHYVGYGAAEGGRDYNTTWIPEILLRDIYLRPFHAARDAGAATFMSAFNDLNGVPASANKLTLRRVLREEWKFDGFVVSDWDSVIEMISHGYAAGRADAALQAIQAGVDMEMVSTAYREHVKSLIEAGKLDARLVDSSVRNILRVKMRLGLFDKPAPAPPAASAFLAPDALAIAERLAAESAVLLKNDGEALPLSKSIRKVAVVGPLADSAVDQMGCWVADGRAAAVRTPLAALRSLLGATRVAYAPGLKSSRDTSSAGFRAAVEAADGADAVVLFLGEEQTLSGEAHSRAFLGLPGAQEALVGELAKSGKPLVAVIMAGRPLTFPAVSSKVKAVLYAWHPGTMGGPAIASLLFGDAAPSGRLTASFPRTVGQVPVYYNHMNTGRPPSASELGIPMGTPLDPKDFTSKYLDVDFTPEYAFGFGLSYTTFEYTNLRLSAGPVPMGGRLRVTADVANTGSREADEVAQLYIRDLVASVTQPVRELKGFQRVHLKAGERRAVVFTVSTADLAFHNQQMQLVTEPGEFQVWVGPDSARGLQGSFRVTD